MAANWRQDGAGRQRLDWLHNGAKMDWVRGPPAPFDHGVSLQDATTEQLLWLEKEKARCLGTGAWVRQLKRKFVSRAFLVPKPGTNKWRLVIDYRWLNSFCKKRGVKMETRRKLRRLARKGDWMFSFDL